MNENDKLKLETIKKIIVVNGLISGGIGPFLILACTNVEIVSIFPAPESNPLPLVNAVTIKSSKDRVIESMKPLKTPGKISGKTDLVRACLGAQPKSKAASYKDGSICCNFGLTFK